MVYMYNEIMCAYSKKCYMRSCCDYKSLLIAAEVINPGELVTVRRMPLPVRDGGKLGVGLCVTKVG